MANPPDLVVHADVRLRSTVQSLLRGYHLGGAVSVRRRNGAIESIEL
jgi:hypothetical protein